LTLTALEAIASKRMSDRPATAVRAPGYHRGASLYHRLAAPLWEATVGRRAVHFVGAELGARVPPGGDVLDLGAGTGRSTLRVLQAARPGRVVAVDASAPMLAQARAALDDSRVEFCRAEAQALPFPDDTFDVVVSMWMLETLPDALSAVREALRVLKATGTVITAFSTTPAQARGSLPRLIEGIMRPLFAGRFLLEHQRPLHRCTKRCAHRYELGMTTVGIFGKGCHPEVLLPHAASAGTA
jgi:ubiquinone/menaquinone biosynthesis C-methylase UbiE